MSKPLTDEDLAYFQRDLSEMDGEHVGTIVDEVIALRAEVARMKPVFELCQRWCNRPVSVLAYGREVLAHDAALFAELHMRVRAANAPAPIDDEQETA